MEQKLQVQLPESHRTGVYSNIVSISVRDDDVTLDFGYMVAPGTAQVVARVNMTEATAEKFVTAFQNAILDHRNKRK